MDRAKLNQLYRVFARYPQPVNLAGCPCCTSPDESRVLCTKTLQELTAPELEHFAFKALSTWGTLENYKYFLPRIFELTWNGDLLCEVEVTLGKLAYSNFSTWPDDEQKAIQDCIFALWHDCVRAADTDKADALICGSSGFLSDVSFLLEYADKIVPDFKFAYAAAHTNQTKRRLLNSFWDRTSKNHERMLQWIYPLSTKAS